MKKVIKFILIILIIVILIVLGINLYVKQSTKKQIMTNVETMKEKNMMK